MEDAGSDSSFDPHAEILEENLIKLRGDLAQLREGIGRTTERLTACKALLGAIIQRGLADVRASKGYELVEDVRELEDRKSMTDWVEYMHCVHSVDDMRARWTVRVLQPILSACAAASVLAGKAFIVLTEPSVKVEINNPTYVVRLRMNRISDITKDHRKKINELILPYLYRARAALKAFLVEHKGRKSAIPKAVLTDYRACSNDRDARVQFFTRHWDMAFENRSDNREFSTFKTKASYLLTLAQYPLKASVHEAYEEMSTIIDYIEERVLIVAR